MPPLYACVCPPVTDVDCGDRHEWPSLPVSSPESIPKAVHNPNARTRRSSTGLCTTPASACKSHPQARAHAGGANCGGTSAVTLSRNATIASSSASGARSPASSAPARCSRARRSPSSAWSSPQAWCAADRRSPRQRSAGSVATSSTACQLRSVRRPRASGHDGRPSAPQRLGRWQLAHPVCGRRARVACRRTDAGRVIRSPVGGGRHCVRSEQRECLVAQRIVRGSTSHRERRRDRERCRGRTRTGRLRGANAGASDPERWGHRDV